MHSIIIGGIVATTKTIRCYQRTNVVFFLLSIQCWCLFYQFYPTLARKRTKRECVCVWKFIRPQCALCKQMHWNWWALVGCQIVQRNGGIFDCVPAFSKLKFIEIFRRSSLHQLAVYLFSNLMQAKWRTASIFLFLSFRFIVIFTAGSFLLGSFSSSSYASVYFFCAMTSKLARNWIVCGEIDAQNQRNAA